MMFSSLFTAKAEFRIFLISCHWSVVYGGSSGDSCGSVQNSASEPANKRDGWKEGERERKKDIGLLGSVKHKF